jgi:hypothetical protein
MDINTAGTTPGGVAKVTIGADTPNIAGMAGGGLEAGTAGTVAAMDMADVVTLAVAAASVVVMAVAVTLSAVADMAAASVVVMAAVVITDKPMQRLRLRYTPDTNLRILRCGISPSSFP